MSQLHDILTLTTPGVTLTDLSGGNLAVSGSQITANNNSTSYRCETRAQSDSPSIPLPSASATAECGSVRVNGTVTSVTFSVSALFTQTTASIPPDTHNSASGGATPNQDGFSIAVTVPEDFGDAPASYDQGKAARAVLSDVTLGSTVTEDSSTVANGTSSPNAGASALTDVGDDGVTLGPITSATTSYSTTVAIRGASKAGTVCGWIDFNKNGIFDNPSERACATFLAGATSATLTWSGISGLTTGNTYARFRVGYNATQTQSPIGASDAGEVEDYPLAISTAPTSISCTPGTTYALNQGGTHELLAVNTATGQSTVVTNFGTSIPNTDLNALGLTPGGSAVYVTQQHYTTVGGQSLVNVYRFTPATGTIQTVGTIAVSAADPNVVMGGVDPTTGIYWVGAFNQTLNTFEFYAFNTTTNTSLGLQFRTAFPNTATTNGDLAFDSSGRMFVVMSAGDGTAVNNRLVDFQPPLISSGATVTGQLIAKLQPYTVAVNGVAFGADGFLYTEANSGPNFAREIRKIDPATGAIIATMPLLNPDGTANADAADLGSCASPNSLSLQKNIAGRANAGDQFGLAITGNGISANNTAVTSGSTGGVQTAPSEVVGPILVIPGRTYTITEQGADGADLAGYASQYQCVDTLNGNAVVASGTGTTGPVLMPSTTNSGSNVVCTFTNTPLIAGLSLLKSAALTTDANNDGKAGVGDVIAFSFTVKNTGTAPLTNVSVVDQLAAPGGPAVSVTCPSTTLAPGATVVCASSPYTVTQADVDAGSVANSATASGTPPTGAPVVTPPSTTTTPSLVAPGLSLDKKVSVIKDSNADRVIDVGDTIQWTFTLRNIGNVTLRAVNVGDALLAEAGIAVVCPRTTLEPTESMTCASAPYTITQADANAGHVANTAVSRGTTPSASPVVSRPSRTLTRVGPEPRVATPGLGGFLAFTGVSSGLYAAALAGLLALLLGLLFVWLGRRPREVGRHPS
nr:GEVED domain-containing protein [Pedococcus badiiscoriae]